MRKLWMFAFCALISLMTMGRALAQGGGWQPPAGHEQRPLWPGAAPDVKVDAASGGQAGASVSATPGASVSATPAATPAAERLTPWRGLTAGRQWNALYNVSTPTMTVFEPKGANTGAAVVIFPGGGYSFLAIDVEGTEVCDWLTSRGLTAVLVKYRVPNQTKNGVVEDPQALQDAQRAVGLVRAHAAQWHVDPHKIGVIGFSAGGNLVAALSTHFDKRLYAAVDDADKESCRPDFTIACYPGDLTRGAGTELRANVPVTKETPPTFIVQAEDDKNVDVKNPIGYYLALKQAGVPVEMHLYAQGGHGFGLRRTKLPVTEWPTLAEKWLRTIGIISK